MAAGDLLVFEGVRPMSGNIRSYVVAASSSATPAGDGASWDKKCSLRESRNYSHNQKVSAAEYMKMRNVCAKQGPNVLKVHKTRAGTHAHTKPE